MTRGFNKKQLQKNDNPPFRGVRRIGFLIKTLSLSSKAIVRKSIIRCFVSAATLFAGIECLYYFVSPLESKLCSESTKMSERSTNGFYFQKLFMISLLKSKTLKPFDMRVYWLGRECTKIVLEYVGIQLSTMGLYVVGAYHELNVYEGVITKGYHQGLNLLRIAKECISNEKFNPTKGHRKQTLSFYWARKDFLIVGLLFKLLVSTQTRRVGHEKNYLLQEHEWVRETLIP
uniref:Uncharacterized protein n=1 Tax=Glossina pallidipes TaxID=7398 RepID=A0A1A9ZJA5_GLOPL